MNRPLRLPALPIACVLALSACGGGGGGGNGGTPSGGSTPTPPPSPASCPTSGSLPTSIPVSGAQIVRRAAVSSASASRAIPGTLIVSYGESTSAPAIDRSALSYVVHAGPDFVMGTSGLRAHVVDVQPGSETQAMAQLRKTPGVVRVERAQYRRRMSTFSDNDPYYNGFGPGAPYFESATDPGQWDMWAINVGSAWGAYNSPMVQGAPIAIIDTGVDVTHPDLQNGKIVRTECFVTFPAGSAQTNSIYVTDTDGHGTNVAGIADTDTDNNFGFAGVGFDSPMLAYRIFPSDPSGGCESSTSPQCSTTDVDEVSAINDAVANGAKVINLSLGSPGPLATCSDTIEENAIESAIQQGVVVVAAAGNEGAASLDCPAAYPGVIAVGASGLNDSGSTIKEVVASYSNHISPGQESGGGVYLAAPGGTATASSDGDQLHWIANITSGQQANAGQFCTTDIAGETGDCQGLFAGTSQATPHVAGTVALMLGLTPSLTPAQIAADLCGTADNINDPNQGCGRLDAGKAVALAASQ